MCGGRAALKTEASVGAEAAISDGDNAPSTHWDNQHLRTPLSSCPGLPTHLMFLLQALQQQPLPLAAVERPRLANTPSTRTQTTTKPRLLLSACCCCCGGS